LSAGFITIRERCATRAARLSTLCAHVFLFIFLPSFLAPVYDHVCVYTWAACLTHLAGSDPW
jgi:hypothetical protein